MTRTNRRLLLGLISLILIKAPITVHAQDEAAAISIKFEEYNRLTAREKIYLQTDKNFYLAGEICWFKAYCINGGGSRIAYVEILDRASKPVLQAKISLGASGGDGSFYLPLTIPSDNYIIRAYTNEMKNGGPAVFFEKSIGIANTMKAGAARQVKDSTEVVFFPEGGHLVQGLETKLGFLIKGKDGKGINARGVIVGEANDTVLNFSAARFGIGSFLFKPEGDKQYRAIISLPDGRSVTRSLPSVFQSGYVMNVTDNKDGRLKIRIQAKRKEATERGEKVFLLVHTRQELKNAEYGFVNYESDLIFYINKAKLGKGVSHITLFNSNKQPVCERLVFNRPEKRNDMQVSIDKNSYNTREKIDMTLAVPPGNGSIDSAGYSISVFQFDELQAMNQDNIVNYYWLTSDLRGTVEMPEFYFSEGEGVEQAADDLMLTQGWRRFNWQDLLNRDMTSFIKFKPEYRGHVVTAKVTDSLTGKPAIDIDCFLSLPSTPYGFYATRTDSNGWAHFSIKNYYGPGEIIVQAIDGKGTVYRTDIQTPFSDERGFSSSPFLMLNKNDENKYASMSVAMQSRNIYDADSSRKFSLPMGIDTLPFFGKAEYSYKLDEYKRFTTMEEVLREYVTSINVVLRNGKLHLSVYDETNGSLYNSNVLVLLDGVPLKDYNKIFAYDPLKIRRLDVIPRRYLLGSLGFAGIASFESYNGKFDGFELDPSLITVDYDGLQLNREFYSPVYETTAQRQKRIPDFRSTLFWSPDITTDRSGKGSLQFYSSDLKGKFIIWMQGIDSKGQPVAASSSFVVE